MSGFSAGIDCRALAADAGSTGFGLRRIDSGDETCTLRSSSAHEALELNFGRMLSGGLSSSSWVCCLVRSFDSRHRAWCA